MHMSPQRALSSVSDDEWNSIPEVGDARNKKQRNAHIRPDRYTPVPDSLLQRATAQQGAHTRLDSRQQVCGWGGTHKEEEGRKKKKGLYLCNLPKILLLLYS